MAWKRDDNTGEDERKWYPKHEGRYDHRVRAELALGKPLPTHRRVHHADGSMRPTAQLVICENQSYHKLLHSRMKVVTAGGDPNRHRVCSLCLEIKEASDMTRREIAPGVQAYSGWCLVCKRRKRADYAVA